jgi:hypothetical protein
MSFKFFSWMCFVLVMDNFGCGAVATPTSESPTPRIGGALQGGPPPPSSVPDNASIVTATVRNYSIWPPGSLAKTLPPVASGETLHSVTLEIVASQPEGSELDSLAVPGAVVEAFSQTPLRSDLVGKQVKATLKLRGDTRGVRWWISNIRLVP